MKPIFINEKEAWYGLDIIPVPEPFQPLVAYLIAGSHVVVCVDPDAHRESYLYMGNGVWVCGFCRQLKKEVC